MSSLSPQLLASALPSHVALTFGPSPARPREVYCITFNPPLAAAAATAAAAGNIGSVPAPPAQLNTPLPPYPSHAGFITIRNNHQHEQLQQAWTGVGGGLGEEGPAAEGTAQEPAAEGSAPAAAAAALQLGPDPCAAAAAVLTERERSALRRAMRGLVVSQEQVPAWEKLLRECRCHSDRARWDCAGECNVLHNAYCICPVRSWTHAWHSTGGPTEAPLVTPC